MVSRFLQLGVSSWLTMVLSGCLTASTVGCVSMTGASEAGVGYRSETKLFFYHETNKELEGTKAEFKVDLVPLVDMIIRLGDDDAEASETEPVDSSPD